MNELKFNAPNLIVPISFMWGKPIEVTDTVTLFIEKESNYWLFLDKIKNEMNRLGERHKADFVTIISINELKDHYEVDVDLVRIKD